MWPPEALAFLRELEDNNDRAWFKANRAQYDAHLLRPARELAGKLSRLGEPRFFRPFRDTRFRPGPPIKEEIAVGIGDPAIGGYYFQLSLDGLLLGAGLHHPESDQLERFRRAIDDAHRLRSFESTVATARAGGLELIGPDLKRAPKGYSPDHPQIERLKLKRITAFARHELGPWLHQPAADERIVAQLTAARPLVRWLTETVGPTTRQRTR